LFLTFIFAVCYFYAKTGQPVLPAWAVCSPLPCPLNRAAAEAFNQRARAATQLYIMTAGHCMSRAVTATCRKREGEGWQPAAGGFIHGSPCTPQAPASTH